MTILQKKQNIRRRLFEREKKSILRLYCKLVCVIYYKYLDVEVIGCGMKIVFDVSYGFNTDSRFVILKWDSSHVRRLLGQYFSAIYAVIARNILIAGSVQTRECRDGRERNRMPSAAARSFKNICVGQKSAWDIAWKSFYKSAISYYLLEIIQKTTSFPKE